MVSSVLVKVTVTLASAFTVMSLAVFWSAVTEVYPVTASVQVSELTAKPDVWLVVPPEVLTV